MGAGALTAPTLYRGPYRNKSQCCVQLFHLSTFEWSRVLSRSQLTLPNFDKELG